MSRQGEFESAIGPHLRPAYNLARWLTHDADDAEDVLQEAMVRAFRHFDSFRGANPRAWFLAIVRNACWSWMAKKRPPHEELDEESAIVPLQRAPEAELLRADQASRIQDEVALLRPEFREVFLLREVEGLSHKEIAEVAGVPIGTVMSRLSRARRELQQRLAGLAMKASGS